MSKMFLFAGFHNPGAPVRETSQREPSPMTYNWDLQFSDISIIVLNLKVSVNT